MSHPSLWPCESILCCRSRSQGQFGTKVPLGSVFHGPQPTARSNPRTRQEKETLSKLPAFTLLSLVFLYFLFFIFSSALSRQLSNIFDVEYVNCQLRHSGILEAIHIQKEGYPVRLPFQGFLARYRGVLAWDPPAWMLCSLRAPRTALVFVTPRPPVPGTGSWLAAGPAAWSREKAVQQCWPTWWGTPRISIRLERQR